MPNTDINSSKLAKTYGLNVGALERLTRMGKKKKIKLNVCVPKDTMEEIRNLWKNYQKVMKERRHAGILDKLKRVTTKKDDYTPSAKEAVRLNKLLTVFRQTDNYITEAAEFFDGCRGGKEIKKYANQIAKDYKTLHDKGYLPGYKRTEKPTDANPDNKHLNKDNFKFYITPQADPRHNNIPTMEWFMPSWFGYADYATSAYSNFYDTLNDFCQNRADALLHGLENALAKLEIYIGDLDEEVQTIRKAYSEVVDCGRAIDELATLAKKSNDGKLKSMFENLKYNFDIIRDNYTVVNNISNREYFKVIWDNNVHLPHLSNITQELTGCARRLDEFGSWVMSGKYTKEDLKDKFSRAISDYNKMQDELAKGGGLFELKSNNVIKQNSYLQRQMRVIHRKYDELSRASLDLRKGIGEYREKQSEFMGEYIKWKTERREERIRNITFFGMGALGILNTAIMALNPLLEAFLTAYSAPVSPLKPKPAS